MSNKCDVAKPFYPLSSATELGRVHKRCEFEFFTLLLALWAIQTYLLAFQVIILYATVERLGKNFCGRLLE